MKVLSFIAVLAGCANSTTGDDIQFARVKQFIKPLRTRTLVFFLALIAHWNIAVSQDQKEEARLELVRNFLLDLRSDYTSNSAIMEKYIQSAGYFAVDSIRQMADEWMNHTRTNLKSIGLEHMEILKYLEHEDEFMTMDNPPGMPLAPAILQKLSFTLDTPTAHDLPVDLDDLYVVRIKNKYNLFVLFTDHDKILSFRIYGSVVTLECGNGSFFSFPESGNMRLSFVLIVPLPANECTWLGGKGLCPGQFAEDLRHFELNGRNVSVSGDAETGNAPANNGNCQ